MIATKTLVQVADLAAEEGYIERRDPGIVEAVELGGVRTASGCPNAEGERTSRCVCHTTPRSSSLYRQADRTGAKLRQPSRHRHRERAVAQRTPPAHTISEALEQQTATSEVLSVISSSPGDLQPVFATMVENAVRICHAKWGNIHRWDGEALHLVASHNTPPALAAFRRSSSHYRPHPKALFGRLASDPNCYSNRRCCGSRGLHRTARSGTRCCRRTWWCADRFGRPYAEGEPIDRRACPGPPRSSSIY